LSQIQIPIKVLKKAREAWIEVIEQKERKSGGCPICNFMSDKTHKPIDHDESCQDCPLHPEICCSNKHAHIEKPPLYWRYRHAYERSADFTKLAEECVAVLDKMIAEQS